MVENTKNAELITEITRDAEDNDGLRSVTIHRNGDLTARYTNGFSNTYSASHPANAGISFPAVAATLRKTIKH